MIDTESKYALITGGSSGVGRQYAFQLAAKGYNILIISNNAEANVKIANDIKEQFAVDIQYLYLDLTQASATDAIIDFVNRQSLCIEVLICNAGMLVFGGTTSTTATSLQQIINLHCTIPTLLCREFGKRMSENRKGYILIMSSATAWMAYPTIATYSATKSYLKTFSRALWYELRDMNVKVTTVFPGAIDTPFYSLNDKMRSSFVRWHMMQTPEFVARKGLRALFNGHHKCIPGVFTKCCVLICALLPAFALLPILSIKRVRALWH